MLFESYKTYKLEGIVALIEVKNAKLRYFNDSDKIMNWFNENFEKEEDQEKATIESISFSDLLQAFIADGNKMTLKGFENKLIEIVGKKGKGVYGFHRTEKGYKSIVGYRSIILNDNVDNDVEEE